MKNEIINLELPVGMSEGEGGYVLFNLDSTKEMLPIPVVVQGETKEEAIAEYWAIVRYHIEYLEERAREADKWTPLQVRGWHRSQDKKKWYGSVTVFGKNFHFRYGRGMKGGKYIPFTKLNISFFNYWKKLKK